MTILLIGLNFVGWMAVGYLTLAGGQLPPIFLISGIFWLSPLVRNELKIFAERRAIFYGFID